MRRPSGYRIKPVTRRGRCRLRVELDATLSDEDAQAVLSMALNEILCEELRLQCQDLLRDRLGVSPLPGLAPHFRAGPADAPGLLEAWPAAWHPAAW